MEGGVCDPLEFVAGGARGRLDCDAVRHGHEVVGEGARVGARGQVVFVDGALEAVAKVCSVVVAPRSERVASALSEVSCGQEALDAEASGRAVAWVEAWMDPAR